MARPSSPSAAARRGGPSAAIASVRASVDGLERGPLVRRVALHRFHQHGDQVVAAAQGDVDLRPAVLASPGASRPSGCKSPRRRPPARRPKRRRSRSRSRRNAIRWAAPDGPATTRRGRRGARSVLHEQRGLVAYRMSTGRDHRDHGHRLHPHADPRRRRRAWPDAGGDGPEPRCRRDRRARSPTVIAPARRLGAAGRRLPPRSARCDGMRRSAPRPPARALARRSLSAFRVRDRGGVVGVGLRGAGASQERTRGLGPHRRLAGIRARPRDRRRRLGAGGRGDDRPRGSSTTSGARSTWNAWRAPTGAGSAA